MKILFCLSCISILCFSPRIIFNENNFSRNINNYLNTQNKEQTVLNLWHIESFEGGSKSRSKYLEEVALSFNKKNKNCFINVVSLTEEQLLINLQNGKNADIYSFGVGSGNLISSYLLELNDDNNDILNNLKESANFNDKLLCYPYMFGGYVAICRQSKMGSNKDVLSLINNEISKEDSKLKMTFSSGQNINPLESLLNNNIKNLNKNNFLESDSSYSAYINFLKNKDMILIGTTRDLHRCKNRESLGTLENCVYQFLGGYTDLVQYIGVNKNIENSKQNLAKEFAGFILNNNSQNLLKNYGLFPALKSNIYKADYMAEFESILKSSKLSAESVFASYGAINAEKEHIINIICKF